MVASFDRIHLFSATEKDTNGHLVRLVIAIVGSALMFMKITNIKITIVYCLFTVVTHCFLSLHR